MFDSKGQPEGVHELSDDDFAAARMAVVVTALEHGDKLDDMRGN